jgi:hypothetical protein
MFALSLVPLVGLTGAAVDYSRANGVRTALQAATDSAALAGARDGSTSWTSVALNTFNANLAAKGAMIATPSFTRGTVPNGSVTYSGSVTGSVATDFMNVVSISSIDVAVRATALKRPDALPCVLALDPAATSAVKFSDGTVTTDCVIASNSKDSKAITVTDSAAINVSGIYSAGGYDKSQTSVPPRVKTTLTQQSPLADPFATLTIPKPTYCDYNNATYSDTTKTLSPGIYCGGISVINTTKIDFVPGTYYLDGGNLAFGSAATITCSGCTGSKGVTFVLTSSLSPSLIGTVIIDGSAKVSLSAPTGASSPYNGILFFQDPRATAGATFTSGTSINVAGVIYFPNTAITWSGNTTMSSPCMTVVGRTVAFASSVSVAMQGCTVPDYRPFRIPGSIVLTQ